MIQNIIHQILKSIVLIKLFYIRHNGSLRSFYTAIYFQQFLKTHILNIFIYLLFLIANSFLLILVVVRYNFKASFKNNIRLDNVYVEGSQNILISLQPSTHVVFLSFSIQQYYISEIQHIGKKSQISISNFNYYSINWLAYDSSLYNIPKVLLNFCNWFKNLLNFIVRFYSLRKMYTLKIRFSRFNFML